MGGGVYVSDVSVCVCFVSNQWYPLHEGTCHIIILKPLLPVKHMTTGRINQVSCHSNR